MNDDELAVAMDGGSCEMDALARVRGVTWIGKRSRSSSKPASRPATVRQIVAAPGKLLLQQAMADPTFQKAYRKVMIQNIAVKDLPPAERTAFNRYRQALNLPPL